MKDYLDGYLDILPPNQRNKIQEMIKSTSGDVLREVSEDEFLELIRRIARDHSKAVEFIPQGEKLDEERYNSFFSKVQLDLELMFAETQLVEQALGSYDRLYDGIIADLNKEIKSLRKKINSLRLVAEGEEGLTIKSFDFTNHIEMETDRRRFAHLFTDRDGSPIEDAVIERSGSKNYLGLSKRTDLDRLRNEEGQSVAEIKITDKRGEPVPQNLHVIKEAVDDSLDTYWSEVVLADEPIQTAMDHIEGGGAIVKFTITLPRPEIISEISITPFTKYPLEIASISYEEDTETYHVPKELLSRKIESTETSIISFPSVIAKRLTFILRQTNYTKNTYLIREKEISKASLWDKISRREAEVTLQGGGTVSQEDLNQYSGWNIYLEEMKKYEKEFAQWSEEFASYQEWKKKAEAYQQQWRSYEEEIKELNDKYGQYGVNYTADPNALE